MATRGRRMRWIAAMTVAACLGGAAIGRAQFISYNDRTTAIIEGNWQSCREADGQYSERVYDGKWPGLGPFELHMGPYHEFALFKGIQDDHREHGDGGNLLQPFKVELSGHSAKHTWDVGGLRLDVALAGGSNEQCESWFISLKRSS